MSLLGQMRRYTDFLFEEMRQGLLNAPEHELAKSLHPLIKKWEIPVTALQALEVLDQAVQGSLASGFGLRRLQVVFEAACKLEGKTQEEVFNEAPWRKT